MSYYRYITGVYKSYLPDLNRTLRSSSVPRTVPQLDLSESKNSKMQFKFTDTSQSCVL